MPPNKASAHSDRYKGILDAKAQPKQNTNRKNHIDAHFVVAVVKFVRDFAAAHPHTCIFLSVDDKAKVNGSGKPAVSWYFQNKKNVHGWAISKFLGSGFSYCIIYVCSFWVPSSSSSCKTTKIVFGDESI